MVKKNDLSLEYQADCPYCGDHSYPVEIKGQVIIGHTAKVAWDNTEMQGRRAHLCTVKQPEKKQSNE